MSVIATQKTCHIESIWVHETSGQNPPSTFLDIFKNFGKKRIYPCVLYLSIGMKVLEKSEFRFVPITIPGPCHVETSLCSLIFYYRISLQQCQVCQQTEAALSLEAKTIINQQNTKLETMPRVRLMRCIMLYFFNFILFLLLGSCLTLLNLFSQMESAKLAWRGFCVALRCSALLCSHLSRCVSSAVSSIHPFIGAAGLLLFGLG